MGTGSIGQGQAVDRRIVPSSGSADKQAAKAP
jgi:hypothetical protein